MPEEKMKQGGGWSLKTRITVVTTIYVAIIMVLLAGTIVHLQRQNFRIKAREDSVALIKDLSGVLFHKWDPARTPQVNALALKDYAAGASQLTQDSICYAAFQDADQKVRYIAKAEPEFMWMMNITRLDPYTQRLLGISSSASRTFSSYPEGKVTEYMGAVYGKDRRYLGIVKVGVSDTVVRLAMGQMTRVTMLRILTVLLVALLLTVITIFYAATALENRLTSMHRKARQMLTPGEARTTESNILVQLTHELEEIETLVSSLKRKFTELTTTLSHEFRSPMQAISGYVELLRRGAAGPVNPQQDKYLKIIGDNAERFQSFIDNVIDLVKLGGGNLSISVVPFNPGDINKRIAELFGPQAQENGITLANTTAAGLPFAYGDPNRVYQIMVNLVTNAVKFTPAGGRIEIGAREDAGYVRMWVSDTGVGIDIEHNKSLFTEFYQVPGQEPVRGFKGLGIGLALCKKLAEAQGAEIFMESTPGEGTTVSLRVRKV